MATITISLFYNPVTGVLFRKNSAVPLTTVAGLDDQEVTSMSEKEKTDLDIAIAAFRGYISNSTTNMHRDETLTQAIDFARKAVRSFYDDDETMAKPNTAGTYQ